MNTKALRVFVLACLGSLLCGPAAYADLGNCFVFRGGDSHLEGDFYDETTKVIYDAYSASRWSDQDFVFVLDIAGTSRPRGSYDIQRIELVMGDRAVIRDPWTLRGYKITAPDVSGIRNGVAEIVAAFKAGVDIIRLQSGPRSGPVATPLTREPSPN